MGWKKRLFKGNIFLTDESCGRIALLSLLCKARGKKGVMEELLNKVNELAFDPENSIFFISHSDCLEDAVQLDLKLRAKWNVKDTVITDISPAFGAHCGPGALAIFFVGKETQETEQIEEPEIS